MYSHPEFLPLGLATVSDFYTGLAVSNSICLHPEFHEINRRLLLGRKVMTNLDSILNSREIADSNHVTHPAPNPVLSRH